MFINTDTFLKKTKQSSTVQLLPAPKLILLPAEVWKILVAVSSYENTFEELRSDGCSSNGSCTAEILSSFPASIHRLGSIQTYSSKVAGADSSRPLRVAEASTRASGQTFSYLEETSGTRNSPSVCRGCTVGMAALGQGKLGRIGESRWAVTLSQLYLPHKVIDRIAKQN